MPETQRHAHEAPVRSHRRRATASAALAALLALLLIGASTAHADVVRRTSGATITVNDASGEPAAATPFPATLSVSGQTRAIVGVRVKLNDVSHTYAGDLDVALIGPNGHRVMLMSDAGGGSDLTATDLTFDDEAAGTVPLNQTVPAGTYRPTDNDNGVGTPDPFPGEVPQDYASRLDEFTGHDPNGTWKLLVVDDAGGAAGQIGGWSLTIETGASGTFSDTIAMVDDGTVNRPATPYGAPIEISGVQGRIAEASVELNGLSHADPGDIDIVLSGPGGEALTLMSDAGGVADVSNRTLRFDDDALATLSDTDPIQDGAYKPTNNQGEDTFPAPAPVQSDATSLSVFDGANPNGTWKLWVVDDSGGASGAIVNGWSLDLVIKPYVRFSKQENPVAEDAGQRTITVSRPEGGGAATVQYWLDTSSREHDVEYTQGTLSFGTGQKTKSFPVKLEDDTGDEPDEAVRLYLGNTGGDVLVATGNGDTASLVIEDDDAAYVESDFNGDGREDIAVGAPGEKLGADADAGLVNVIYGAAGGLSATANQVFTQDSGGVPDASDAGDKFGAAVASGDFNADGYSDLAVGVPGEELGAAADSGVVTIIYGSASGLTGTGSAQFGQDSSGVPDASESGDRFGAALAAGNFGRTAHGDLAVGRPGEDIGAANGAGAVTTLYGSAGGLGTTGATGFSQGVGGVTDAAESADAFGSALAAGGLGIGAEDDLTVGVPGETGARGAVHVLYGSPAAGLQAANSLRFTQDSPDVPDTASAGDRFGATLAVSPSSDSDRAKLAIGAPQEDIGDAVDAGVVHMFEGSEEDGVWTGSGQLWAQSIGTVIDVAEDGDRYGTALAFGHYRGSAAEQHEDLAVGVPGETLGGVSEAGAVSVLYADDANADGDLDDAGNQLWHQDSPGVLDANGAGDGFGASLATAGSGTADSLAIGVPGEAAGAGALAVLKGTGDVPLTSTGDLRFKQGAGGMLGPAEAGDGFGGVLTP